MDVGNRRSPAVDVSGRVPRRNLGTVELNGDGYPLVDCGAWTATDSVGSAVTYQAGNLVESGGRSYVALPVAGNTNLPPPNAAYWELFPESSRVLRSDRVWAPVTRDLILVIDGDATAITTGVKGEVRLDMDCVIAAWTLLADQSGSAVVDVWKTPYGSYPPTVANTITGSDKPTLASAIKNTSSALTGWTTTVDAGDTFRVNVDSASTVTRLTLVLKLL